MQRSNQNSISWYNEQDFKAEHFRFNCLIIFYVVIEGYEDGLSISHSKKATLIDLMYILEQLGAIFSEPKGLPPLRPQDHKIQSVLVNMKPYCYLLYKFY